jgi:hypothetical protein
LAEDREDIKFWVAFNALPGVNRIKLNQLEMKETILSSNTEALLLKRITSRADPNRRDIPLQNLSAATVSSKLAMMELKIMVGQVGTMNYGL